MSNAEIAKEIVIAAIEKNLFLSNSSISKSSEETSKDNAKALGEFYKTIFDAVQDATRSNSSSYL